MISPVSVSISMLFTLDEILVSVGWCDLHYNGGYRFHAAKSFILGTEGRVKTAARRESPTERLSSALSPPVRRHGEDKELGSEWWCCECGPAGLQELLQETQGSSLLHCHPSQEAARGSEQSPGKELQREEERSAGSDKVLSLGALQLCSDTEKQVLVTLVWPRQIL